jgi:hypothetical protein
VFVLLLASMTFVQMAVMAGAVRDGWHAEDLAKLIPVLLWVAGTFFAARKMRKAWATVETGGAAESNDDPNRRWLIGTSLVGIVIVIAVLVYLGERQSTESGAEAATFEAPAAPEIQTRIARAPRGDFTEEMFSAEKADELRVQLEGQYLSGVEEAARNSGRDPRLLDLKVDSDAEVSELMGHRIIVIRMAVPGLHRAVTAVGVVGDEIVQVTCMGQSLSAVSLNAGECQSKLGEAFPWEG